MSEVAGRRLPASAASVALAVLLVGAAVAACTVRAPRSDALAARVIPAAVDPTGRTDVTAALQSFLARVPDGSTVLFQAGARYRLDGTLVLRHRQYLTIDGAGATMFAGTRGGRSRAQWDVQGGTGISFRDLNVVGANPHGGTGDDASVPALEAQHGFVLEGVSHVDIGNVTVTDTYGDFVYMTRDADTHVWTSDVRIHDSVFRRNGREGISVVAGRRVTIDHNTITDTRRADFDLEPNTRSEGAEAIQILDNHIGRGRLYVIGGGRAPGVVEGVVVAGNVLHDHELDMLEAPPPGATRADFLIAGNVSDTPAFGAPPLRFNDVRGITVVGNVQPSRNWPVVCNRCTTAIVRTNRFPKA